MANRAVSGEEGKSVSYDSALPDESAVDPSIPAEVRRELRILVVDDDHTLRESCGSILEMQGYDVSLCPSGDDALDLLRRARFDIALIDLYMNEVGGLKLLEAGLQANADLLCIMITGRPSVGTSLEATRIGAWDYLPKPFSASQLQVLIGRAAHTVFTNRRAHDYHAEIQREHGHSEKITVLGVSTSFRKVMEVARRVASTDASVFITGESGVGKELIAQFIHQHSRRNKKPLVPINCAALPDTLLESEMFGHTKGSFTGAIKDKPGMLEIADGGTLFLDEITEMSQATQAKLLRVIQDGVVRRVGSTQTDAVVDVRFMAATNRNPEEAVAEGRLREDLFYRLRVVPIRVPPLRERPDDIPVLARHFVAHYWKRHRDPRQPLPELTPTVVRDLQTRSWPGNVRELQNAIEHAVVFLEPGADIQPDDIPSLDGNGHTGGKSAMATFGAVDLPYHEARDRITAEFERRYLGWVINRAGGNMSEAARIAGIDRTTIYRLMDKHGLERANFIRAAE